MRVIASLLLSLYAAVAQPNPPGDPPALPAPNCVANIDDTNYCRLEYGRWYLTNWDQPSALYLNGVYQSQEPAGTASIDFIYATPKRQIKVGICDSAHGIALDNIVTNIVSCSLFHSTADASGIRECTAQGCSVINVSWFTAVQGEPAVDLSNACYEASQAGVILVCSVPNINESIDSTPALPASLSVPLLIPVTSSTRQDTVYSPAAVGINVIAAPGRVIVTQAPDGSPAYGTGTSYAAPIVAGTVAWLLGQFQQTPSVIVQALRNGFVPIDNRIQGRLSMAGAVNALRATVTLNNGVPEPHGIGQYQIEQSQDLVHWSDYTGAEGSVMFFRARTL